MVSGSVPAEFDPPRLVQAEPVMVGYSPGRALLAKGAPQLKGAVGRPARPNPGISGKEST